METVAGRIPLRDSSTPRFQRFRRVAGSLLRTGLKTAAVVIGILVIAVPITQWTARTPGIVGADGKPLEGSIATLEKVTLNGSEQWITIRGRSLDNPVLLFLAGGPGGSQLSQTRRHLSGLEEHFTVVNWDQPGAGKSYSAVPMSDITPERYIADAHELILQLRDRFGQEKIYLLGNSWGCALGIWLVQRYPELFHAYIGTGQMVAFTENEVMCYELALNWAQERGDAGRVALLQKQGPPPYYGEDVVWKQSNYLLYLNEYMAQFTSGPGENLVGDTLVGSEYGLLDKFNFARGIIWTLSSVFPQLWEVDLRTQAPRLEVPVYFLHGRHDYNANMNLVQEYYDLLEAPHKEIVWFENSGHDAMVNEADKLVDIMANRILPETMPE